MSKHKKPKNKPVRCPYCGSVAHLRQANKIYAKKTDENQYLFVCSKYPICDSYVTANYHKKPRGTLANAELRLLRRETHRIFDLIWKNGFFTQTNAYRWLQSELSLSSYDCHIGRMNIRQCNKAIQSSKSFLEKKGIEVWDWRKYEDRPGNQPAEAS